MFVPSFWPNLWEDFSETWHDDRFFTKLRTQAKILGNDYNDNEKSPPKKEEVFLLENTLELQI